MGSLIISWRAACSGWVQAEARRLSGRVESLGRALREEEAIRTSLHAEKDAITAELAVARQACGQAKELERRLSEAIGREKGLKTELQSKEHALEVTMLKCLSASEATNRLLS